jgi:16S rRNA (cytosine1402-N4)-methyltransferase
VPSEQRIEHQPVLVSEVLELLEPSRRTTGWFVDATVGLGGHAEALLSANPELRLVGLDRDTDALARSEERLGRFGSRARLVHANFHELHEVLGELGIQPGQVVGYLADLGVSSLQLGSAARGFSFRLAGPLDMRMGLSPVTAAEVVNQSSEEDLEKILREYGEEHQARRLARAIVRQRGVAPFATTTQLKELIDKVKGGRASRESRIDPATQVFQALRIAVNEELEGLGNAVEQAVTMMESQGRLVIISYHSGEDRIVKNTLRDLAHGEVDLVTGRTRTETQAIEVLTRKPIRPSEGELEANPRSRSARLRAARRL